MKHLKKFNEGLAFDAAGNHHDIELGGIGATHYENQTNINFVIDGEEYSFTMIEKGEIGDAMGEGDTDFICDTDLPFELTEDMKDQMYRMFDDASH